MRSLKFSNPIIKTLTSPPRHFSTSHPHHQLLKNKKCIITGASRGIGAAIARRFAAEGAECILIGRNEALLNSVREELEKHEKTQINEPQRLERKAEKSPGKNSENESESTQRKHRIIIGDVGSEEFWNGFKKEKNIDILINAAGLTHASPLFTTSPSLLHENIQTNLVGTMLGCRAIGKGMLMTMASRMKARTSASATASSQSTGEKEASEKEVISKGGKEGEAGCSIINVASLLGVKGGRGSAAYAASKAGVIGLTRALAAEVGGKGIRVNVIVPGYIETDMMQGMTPDARSEALNAIPLKRFGESSEVADAAVFLATNAYANNCVLNLDGGLSAV